MLAGVQVTGGGIAAHPVVLYPLVTDEGAPYAPEGHEVVVVVYLNPVYPAPQASEGFITKDRVQVTTGGGIGVQALESRAPTYDDEAPVGPSGQVT